MPPYPAALPAAPNPSQVKKLIGEKKKEDRAPNIQPDQIMILSPVKKLTGEKRKRMIQKSLMNIQRARKKQKVR